MKNKFKYGGLFLSVVLLGVFFVNFVYRWNFLLSVDNAEHLAVDFRPWWQQIRYHWYILITLIPTSVVYLIFRLFGREKVSVIVRISASTIFFLSVFASGIAGTAMGTVELQRDTLKEREYSKQRRKQQLEEIESNNKCDGATAYENLDY